MSYPTNKERKLENLNRNNIAVVHAVSKNTIVDSSSLVVND